MASDLTTAVRGVSAGIDAVKKLTDLALKTQNIELQETTLQLREQLLSVKETLLDTREEATALREENSQLKEKIRQLEVGLPKEEMSLKEGLYYKDNGDGPFCTACYDSKKQAIRVADMPSAMQVLGTHKCPVCSATYGSRF